MDKYAAIPLTQSRSIAEAKASNAFLRGDMGSCKDPDLATIDDTALPVPGKRHIWVDAAGFAQRFVEKQGLQNYVSIGKKVRNPLDLNLTASSNQLSCAEVPHELSSENSMTPSV
jgi:hypothetical protein